MFGDQRARSNGTLVALRTYLRVPVCAKGALKAALGGGALYQELTKREEERHDVPTRIVHVAWGEQHATRTALSKCGGPTLTMY